MALATQPWNRIVLPDPGGPGIASTIYAYAPAVWNADTAIRIPGVSRATAIYAETIKSCPLDAYRGLDPLPRPRLLDQPDPDTNRAWFVRVQIEDYLWHGNAVHRITDRMEDGWPRTVAWMPASRTSILLDPGDPIGDARYYFDGEEIPASDVVHVRRSSDRWNPARGVGIVEEHLATLDRIALEEQYERNTLVGAGVPSVAIIAPNPSLGDDEAGDAKTRWMDKYAGPVREPAILPAGTQVIPLGWSPKDNDLVEARKLSLLDIANLFNLDGYWLGAPTTSLTYRSPGPLYTALLRTSLEGVMVDFEQTWTDAWLPRGQVVRFDRLALTRDDLASMVDTVTKAIAGGVLSTEEGRLYLGLAARMAGASIPSPVDTLPTPAPANEGSPTT